MYKLQEPLIAESIVTDAVVLSDMLIQQGSTPSRVRDWFDTHHIQV
jgi:hypothetical protein